MEPEFVTTAASCSVDYFYTIFNDKGKGFLLPFFIFKKADQTDIANLEIPFNYAEVYSAKIYTQQGFAEQVFLPTAPSVSDSREVIQGRIKTHY
jgi:hypothetical protein